MELNVLEFESSLKIEYSIKELATQTKLTRGSTMQVAVLTDNGELQFQTPEVFQAAIRQFVGFQAA